MTNLGRDNQQLLYPHAEVCVGIVGRPEPLKVQLRYGGSEIDSGHLQRDIDPSIEMPCAGTIADSHPVDLITILRREEREIAQVAQAEEKIVMIGEMIR